MALATVEFVVAYRDMESNAVPGRIRFTPSSALIHETFVYAPIPILVDVGDTVELARTDLTGVTPSDWYWTMTELIPGLTDREISFYVPVALAGLTPPVPIVEAILTYPAP